MNLIFFISTAFLFYTLSMLLCLYIETNIIPNTANNAKRKKLFIMYSIHISVFISVITSLFILFSNNFYVQKCFGVAGIILFPIIRMFDAINNDNILSPVSSEDKE